MRYGITILLFCLHLRPAAQQNNNYIFRHINPADGLMHSSVKSIVQDSKGFIWILTLNGLQRYDGTRFVNYPFDLNDPNRTTAIRDVTLFNDQKENCLWLIGGEIEKLSLDKHKFSFYTADSILKDSRFTFDEYTDSAGLKWLAGSFGFFYFDPAENKMRPYYLTHMSPAPYRSLSYSDTVTGEIWIADFRGLTLFDKKTKRRYTHDYNPINNPLLKLIDKRNLTALFKDSKGNTWIGSNSKEFYRYDNNTQKLHVYSLPSVEKNSNKKTTEDHIIIVKCFFEDNHHNIWLGTENGGLLRYEIESDSFSYTLNEEKNNYALHYNYEIASITQDKEENLWLGTDKGINIFNPYRERFQTVRHDEHNDASMPKKEIQQFIQLSNGDILCGTWGGGVSVFDSMWHFKKNINFPGPYEYNLVWTFAQNDDGNVWIGCQHGYIHIYHPVKGLIKTIAPPELQGSTIWDMKKDSAGNIWMALHNGKIAEWNKQQNKFLAYNDAEKGIDQFFSQAVNIFFDNKQQCWVSTVAGFKLFDTKKRMYTAVYVPDKKNKDALSAYVCNGVEQYNDSMLLVGTAYGGLNYFNTNTKKFFHLTTADGLPSNTIHSIKKDAAGFIWFTTDFDLYKFKPGTNKFIKYNIEPGIVTTEFRTNAFYLLRDGRWATASTAEIICFKTDNTNFQKQQALKPEITGLKVFDKSIEIDALFNSGLPLKLSYKQNFINIEFALLRFSDIHQTNYYYQLNGIDKEWVNAGRKGFASYTNLQPGKYTFSVIADNGLDTTPANSFTIIIEPPFWKTSWFALLIAAIIIVIGYLIIKWREQNIKAIESAKLKVQELNAGQYKSMLEMERIINYFSSSLINKNTIDDVLWDVAKNLIGRLGFEDCIIYLWNTDKTQMVQRAGYGPKGSIEEIEKNVFKVSKGEGIVGHVMQTKEPLLIPDTSKDSRYRVDDMRRLSEITVPIIYDDDLIGVIDSEHRQLNFFTQQHIQVLSTIATLMANKIKSIEYEQSLQQTKIEILGMNEKLTAAKLEALRSQMNPHFIFNCLNSIDNLIQNNEKEKATLYLAKFAKLIRSVLESSKSDTVPCWKDLETLKLYIELEEFRWDKKFSYQLHIADEILTGDYKVPPLVVQPFVENAIHHGLLNKIDADKRLTITVNAGENHIYYCIEDNGVGRAKAAAYKEINKSPNRSMGMQITIERINLFNQEKNGSVKITDLYNKNQVPTGTKVEVELTI